MSRLTVTAEKVGLHADTGAAGRWIRFAGAHGTAYILEAPWSADFAVWSNVPREQPTEYYRDPLEAIEAGLRQTAFAVERRQPGAARTTHAYPMDRRAPKFTERKRAGSSGKPRPLQLACDACGTLVRVNTDSLIGAWLCPDCLCSLPTTEIDRVSQEVAMRGVPMS
jgi:hypothetical protein